MTVRQARVIVEEDPTLAITGRDRSPWREIPHAQFQIYRDMRRSSTGCAAAENAIKQGVLGARFLVEGKGWTKDEIETARVAFMHMNAMAIEHLHTFGIVIIAVDPKSRLPGVVDPEMVRVWHSKTLDGRSFYALKQADVSMMGGDDPIDGVAVFELRQPRDGFLDSPLAPAMKNYNYITMLQQAGVQAATHNANPRVFVQRERPEANAEEELKVLERGSYAVNQRLAAGAVAQAAIIDEERVTRALGIHEVERSGRHSRGIFINGTSRDPLSGSLVFHVTHEPNMHPLLDNQTVAAGPLAQAPLDLQAAIERGEDDIARVYGVPPTLWGDKQTSHVTQSTLVHVYLQTCQAWRSNLEHINHRVTAACQDGVNTGILCNHPTGEQKELEDRQALLDGGAILPRAGPRSMLMDRRSVEEFIESEARMLPDPRTKRRNKRARRSDPSPAEAATGAQDGERVVLQTEGSRRKQLRIRWGSAMDIFAIEQLYEQGRITFQQSQEFIAHLRGLDIRDLTEERLDPQTQRPLAEVLEENKQMEMLAHAPHSGGTGGAGGKAPKKRKTTLEGRDDLVRTPPKTTDPGDRGPSLRTVLTRKAPGMAQQTD